MAQQYGDAELKNAMLNQAGEGTSLADYYGAQRQLGDMVSADEEQGKAMEDYFMTLPGFDTREKAQAFIGQTRALPSGSSTKPTQWQWLETSRP